MPLSNLISQRWKFYQWNLLNQISKLNLIFHWLVGVVFVTCSMYWIHQIKDIPSSVLPISRLSEPILPIGVHDKNPVTIIVEWVMKWTYAWLWVWFVNVRFRRVGLTADWRHFRLRPAMRRVYRPSCPRQRHRPWPAGDWKWIMWLGSVSHDLEVDHVTTKWITWLGNRLHDSELNYVTWKNIRWHGKWLEIIN